MAIEDHALAAGGAVVAYVTSEDTRFPPDAVLDGSTKTYWVSTGLYPQEIVITLPYPVKITRIGIWSLRVHKITIESAAGVKPGAFESIAETEIAPPDPFSSSHDHGHVQVVSLRPSREASEPARQVRLVISSGFSDICGICKILIGGDKVSADSPAARE